MRVSTGLLAILMLVFGIALSRPVSGQPSYDILIENGRVLDGSGNPWVRADLAVQDGEVAAVGELSEATADTVLNSEGLYVAPGFIDVHSHAGGGLTTESLSAARPQLAQGITTVVINPDGGGAVDLAAQQDSLREGGLGVNVGQLVPHGAIREAVMGLSDRDPTEAELADMKALVREGMEAGGLGLSSGPFYVPGSYAETEEFIATASVAAEYGGVYQSHIRDESNYTVGLLTAVDEVIEIAREADLPGIVTHIKALGLPVWELSAAVEHRVERARAEGVEVFADQYPYTASATSLTAALVPRWAQSGGRDSLLHRLDQEDLRARIRDDMTTNLERRGGAGRIQFRSFPPNSSIEGKTLAEVASEREEAPLTTALHLIEQATPGIVSYNMLDEDVERFMRQPWTMTSSDGGLVQRGDGVPHPRNYGAFPRKLGWYARDQEVIDLGFAVRSMTQLSASVMGLPNRGRIQPGAAADLVVFDLDDVHDSATFRAPHQLSEGMVHVLVNGRLAIHDGTFTEARLGRVLSLRSE
ncbi:N-acyl-D-aspartate/D-glutamate deacylase [Salinibacter ruber]|uniref:N-acyl-D-amino-acid deacylase family protein n=1 Tax=Salinibacter ruber TaxID=146919 RepID=UPI002166C19E|nr:D-aminoacylase [Salinibacter ruber]MCS4116044.1 N-acyl-D-aspartate/D-glutamate deacylase [Salinibacter ruber]